jgi:hypothetical protein
MTEPEDRNRPRGRGRGRQALAPEPAQILESQVLELLRRLGAGERLVDAPISMGLSQEQARAMFSVAAELVRRALQEPPPGTPC